MSKVDSNDEKLIWESIETPYLFYFLNNLQRLIINRSIIFHFSFPIIKKYRKPAAVVRVIDNSGIVW